MYSVKLLFFWLSILLFLPPLSGAGQFQDAEWLEQGLLAEFRGEYERALNIWSDARDELDVPDSRIGLEYIRIATEQEMSEYYADATEMYLWAISSPFAGQNRTAIRQEIERLEPVLGDGIYRQWLSWLEEQDDKLSADIRGFWIQMDPTPGKLINERLIEHWQRIAHARANFGKNTNTVYGTDDRALIYIRYGPPDLNHSGILSLDKQNLGRWLEQQFDTVDRTALQDENRSSFHLQEEHTERDDSFGRLEEYVFRFHEQPEYEIWTYHPPADNLDNPLIFIFGTDAHTGEYHRVKSVDDFIPSRAWLADQNSLDLQVHFVRQGLSPALALQMLYYEQLSGVNTFFQERLNTIREAFIEQGSLAYASLDLSLKAQSREMLEMREVAAPLEVSSLDRFMPRIPVEIHQYRFLDENSEPVLITFLESNPVSALTHDIQALPEDREREPATSDPDELVRNEDQLFSHLLNHIFLIYNEEWEETERNTHAPEISFTEVATGTIVQSAFKSPHRNQYFQAASAQLISNDPRAITLYPSIYPVELRGLGTLRSRQPVPLKKDPDSLEMGDLILGYHDNVPDDYPFSFRVANDQTISSDESLILHFEVYNLQPAPETGFTRFELTYRIYPVLEDGSLLTEEEAFYLTINFEDDQTRVIEDLEIQTTTLSSGLYELQVYIEDMVNNEMKNRNIRFEVTN